MRVRIFAHSRVTPMISGSLRGVNEDQAGCMTLEDGTNRFRNVGNQLSVTLRNITEERTSNNYHVFPALMYRGQVLHTNYGLVLLTFSSSSSNLWNVSNKPDK